MAKSFQYKVRKIHRYLGLILGIQFLFWTIGGIYFSWSNMDDIHGDLQRKPASLIAGDSEFVSPAVVLQALQKKQQVDSIRDLKLIEILGKPFYQIQYMELTKDGLNHLAQHELNPKKTAKVQLADALTGILRGPLGRSEAIEIAKMRFNGPAKIKSVSYLTKTSSQHEYRESPLPAYAISFSHSTNTTVYVSTELGTVQKIRNEKWRVFDFLWMMHTMDYNGRDHFGNLLLKAFSIFGLITILSGFVLYYVSSRSVKNLKKRFSPNPDL